MLLHNLVHLWSLHNIEDNVVSRQQHRGPRPLFSSSSDHRLLHHPDFTMLSCLLPVSGEPITSVYQSPFIPQDNAQCLSMCISVRRRTVSLKVSRNSFEEKNRAGFSWIVTAPTATLRKWKHVWFINKTNNAFPSFNDFHDQLGKTKSKLNCIFFLTFEV